MKAIEWGALAMIARFGKPEDMRGSCDVEMSSDLCEAIIAPAASGDARSGVDAENGYVGGNTTGGEERLCGCPIGVRQSEAAGGHVGKSVACVQQVQPDIGAMRARE